MKFPLIIEQQLSDRTVSVVVQVNLSTELITLKQLIAVKVCAEIEQKRQEQNTKHNTMEARLNQTHPDKELSYDLESEINKALEQFMRNGFFVLVDGQQIAELNDIIQWHKEMEVVFLQLVALEGG